jgi:hypothetical protein
VPVTQESGRVIGLLAFYNSPQSPDYLSRHVFLARHIGRQAASIVEAQFDLMTGLYTRSGLDQMCAGMPEEKADLVIKDTHHHSFARRTFLINTDWHLTRTCAVPLLLTKAKPWSPLPIIMAAVDPNHANPRVAALDREILCNAATPTGRLKGDLHVIHSFVPTAFAAVVAAGGRSTTPEYSDALKAENSYLYSQIGQFVRSYGVAPEQLHVEMGTPEVCLWSRYPAIFSSSELPTKQKCASESKKALPLS